MQEQAGNLCPHKKNKTNLANLAENHTLEKSRTGTYSAKLDNTKMGIATSLKVSKGDSIKLKVFGQNGEGTTGDALPPQGIEFFVQTPMQIPIISADENDNPIQNNTAVEGNAFILGVNISPNFAPNSNPNPEAKVELFVYDKDILLIDSKSKTVSADNYWEELQIDFKAEKEGFVIVKLSNASVCIHFFIRKPFIHYQKILVF